MKSAKAPRRAALFGVLGSLWLAGAVARAELLSDDAAVKRALSDEITRSMQELVLPGEPAPYFVGYTLVDREVLHVNATFGAELLDDYAQVRHVAVTVRVGSHELEGANTGSRFGSWTAGPIDDDYVALRHELWLGTDDAYKAAIEELSYKNNMMKTRMARRTEEFPDFVREERHETVRSRPVVDLGAAREQLRRLATEVSRSLASVVGLKTAVVGVTVEASRRRLLTSEQTWADEGRLLTEVVLLASTQAEDGMPIERRLSVTARSPNDLPPLDQLRDSARAFADRVVRAREARLADNGTAVILFEGRAAAQLVQALLVPGLDGSPPPRFAQADVDRSFASKLGFQLTASLLDVDDDPTLLAGPGGEAIWGSYAADDEGVPAERVSIVERGVLKTLLMSRTPRREIALSNAHFRLGAGGPAIGTLVVSSQHGRSRKHLLALAERESRGTGIGRRRDVYVVTSLGPAFAAGGMLPPSFSVSLGSEAPLNAELGLMAVEAYRFVDGKEEPVRGLVLHELELRTLRDVVGVGDRPYVYNHMQGLVPETIISPSLLVTDVDVKRFSGENPKLMSYPPP